MAHLKYLVDGLELNYCGFNGVSQCYYFTKEENGSNKMVEIPFSFDGVIFPHQEANNKVPLHKPSTEN